jgi:hypothetical protein
MTKFLTVGLAAVCLMGGAGQAQADSVAMENWQVVFTGSDGAKVHGSIHWIDNKNPNKPTYMETVDEISQASKNLTLPAGAIVSATGSSDAIKPVIVKIYRNRVECDDAPDPTKSFSNSKTCSN